MNYTQRIAAAAMLAVVCHGTAGAASTAGFSSGASFGLSFGASGPAGLQAFDVSVAPLMTATGSGAFDSFVALLGTPPVSGATATAGSAKGGIGQVEALADAASVTVVTSLALEPIILTLGFILSAESDATLSMAAGFEGGALGFATSGIAVLASNGVELASASLAAVTDPGGILGPVDPVLMTLADSISLRIAPGGVVFIQGFATSGGFAEIASTPLPPAGTLLVLALVGLRVVRRRRRRPH